VSILKAKIGLIIFLIYLGYCIFHVGRSYEARIASREIEKALDHSVGTYYFIPEWDERYPGEIAVGNCIPNRVAEDLLRYASLDY